MAYQENVKPLIGDDHSINTFDGKTDQTQFKNSSIEQIPFSRCVPGPLSLRRGYYNNVAGETIRGQNGSVGVTQLLHIQDGASSIDHPSIQLMVGDPAPYKVTKDNTGN